MSDRFVAHRWLIEHAQRINVAIDSLTLYENIVTIQTLDDLGHRKAVVFIGLGLKDLLDIKKFQL